MVSFRLSMACWMRSCDLAGSSCGDQAGMFQPPAPTTVDGLDDAVVQVHADPVAFLQHSQAGAASVCRRAFSIASPAQLPMAVMIWISCSSRRDGTARHRTQDANHTFRWRVNGKQAICLKPASTHRIMQVAYVVGQGRG